MAFLTDRKRAEGFGASHTGTQHHWFMTVSAVALLILMPLFIFIVGRALGSGYESVIATFSRPFPAVVTALALIVGMVHFHKGARMMIEDYTHGAARHWLIIMAICVSYALIAAGLFALVKIAL